MNANKILFTLALILLFAMASAAVAQERDEGKPKEDKDYIPTTTVFHLDIRALSVFDATGTGLMRREDPEDEYGILSSFSGLGTGVGVKMGALIDGHHDVGGHLRYTSATVRTYFNPEDERADEIETRTDSGDFRIAAYYNYNWHAKGWVMPYVGPVLGFEVEYSRFQDLDDDDAEVTTAMVTGFAGIEGGVKLFPMKNVAFDIALTSTAGPTLYKQQYGDDRDDDDFGGGTFDLALNAGLCVYFE